MRPRRSLRKVRQTSTLPLLTDSSLTIQQLSDEHVAEALAFLNGRAVHTVLMAGFIRDNRIVNPLNRGTFYACRNNAGRIEGVALIGHITLIETENMDVLQAFAHLARECAGVNIIIGEEDKLSLFWNHYAEAGRRSRLLCRELLFERSGPAEASEEVKGMRPATLNDLDLIMPVHAQMVFEECGVNPMEVDPSGFRLRCARRIERERVWVYTEESRLIFKADIVSETQQATYLEGIYVDPSVRRQGYGRRCLAQLERNLFERTESISLLVNEKNEASQNFFRRVGYKPLGYYETIYLEAV